MKPVPIHLNPDSRSQGIRIRSWHRDGVFAVGRVHHDLQSVFFTRWLCLLRRNTAADKQQNCNKSDRIHLHALSDPAADHRFLR
jgi:hypothetical protein